jgi:transposase-like protein
MRKHYTEAQRAELIALVTRGGATPWAAAARLGTSESTAYYWLKRSGGQALAAAVAEPPLRRRPTTAPVFARLIPATEAGLTITLRVGDTVIAVQRGFDAELRRDVVAALAGCAP